MLFENRQIYIPNSALILTLLGAKPCASHRYMRGNAKHEQVVLSMEAE